MDNLQIFFFYTEYIYIYIIYIYIYSIKEKPLKIIHIFVAQKKIQKI